MKYSNEYLNEYIKIIDNKTKKVIASGKVIDIKSNTPNGGISFDGKWFFKETKNLSYEKVSFVDTFIQDIFPDYLTVNHWRNFVENNNVDIYRDFCYEEIDKEIKPYIDKLNKIKNITTVSSCCGHGSGFWYIEFVFVDFDTLKSTVNITETFNGKLILGTHLRTGGLDKNFINLTLKPDIEDINFDLLNKFVNRLSNVLKYKE